MPTNFSTLLRPDASTTANLRAWAQFVEDTFVTVGGWTVASDTGQTLPSALVGSGVTLTKLGYRIYCMSDALQSTSPVFLRIDYGSGQGPTTCPPSIWLTIGTGSNGSGTITGTVLNSQNISNAIAAYSTTLVNNSYGSAFHNRCAITMFVQNLSYHIAFGIERTKDATGADTGEGVLVAHSSIGITSVALQYSYYLILAGGIQPTREDGLSYILTMINPSQTFAPGDTGLGILIHFKGLSQQPGMNWMFCNLSDISAEGTISTTIYGARRTYQHLNAGIIAQISLTGTGSVADTNVRVLMRYD